MGRIQQWNWFNFGFTDYFYSEIIFLLCNVTFYGSTAIETVSLSVEFE